jgi:erythromycin esterase-like protein
VYYPGRKIIVWAHSGHIGRNMAPLRSATGRQPFADGQTVQLGAEVHRAIGAEMYSIGFTAATGSYGFRNSAPVPIPAVTNGSLEDLLVTAGFENAFLDLRRRPEGGEWLRDVYSSPLGYQSLRGDWPTVFDGIVFTRVMTPNTAASR